jgi:hypothetical protein
LQGRLDWLRAGDAGPKGAQQEDTPKKEYAVMPAKAGIHFASRTSVQWMPAFAGMTSDTCEARFA